MRTNINENIKLYRKEHKFTQEQLAEAMGVSVGAVSKWESGLSVPDIETIMELADFFGISVDSLIGYQIKSNDIKDTVERIKISLRQKRYDIAIPEVEKALQKYPNCFDILYESASIYKFIGIEKHNEKYLRKAQKLFERSLALADQSNASVGIFTIRGNIGEIYLSLGEKKKGIEYLKNNNSDGLFNSLIGYTLSPESSEALPYLSDSLINCVCELFNTAVGLANVYANEKEFELGEEVLLWCNSIHEGLKIPGKNSFLDKSRVMLLTACAKIAVAKGDAEATMHYLKEAKKAADEFDAAPNYTSKNLKFYSKEMPATSSDDFGATAVEGIESAVLAAFSNAESKGESADLLRRIWEEVKKDG